MSVANPPIDSVRGNRTGKHNTFNYYPPHTRRKPLITVKRVLLVGIVVLFFAATIGLPYLFWVVAPELPLRIVVVDKTVPFGNHREHRGLFWLLDQNKLVDRTVAPRDREYDFAQDYIGFHPTNPPEAYIADILTPEALAGREVLYLADTYGVYEADYQQFPNKNIAATRRSQKIYGGLQPEEVEAIENFARAGRLLIGEFNTFASPTAPELRQRMEALFGVSWTGWMGRYFLDFSDTRDVPEWLVNLYLQRTGKAHWDLRGSGYLLCRDEGHSPDGTPQFIILRDEVDVQDRGLQLYPDAQYADRDVMHGVRANKCNYWFDIVIPHERTEVLAKYRLHLTERGQAKVEEFGTLLLEFPAVVRGSSNYTSYYFAGDFVDFDKAMGPPRTRLTLYINRSYWTRQAPGGSGCFFWHTYYPLMSNILRLESARRNNGIPRNPLLFD